MMISRIKIIFFYKLIFKPMNTTKIKNNSTTKIKAKIHKFKFDILTNENDFLVKNLKKAG